MRTAAIERKTKETDIKATVTLDGEGRFTVSTSIPFLDHMISLMSKHGLFDITLKAR
jgi:imidazoleglycerol-phosphate dehydratase